MFKFWPKMFKNSFVSVLSITSLFSFYRDAKGNIVMSLAFILPVLLLVISFSIDTLALTWQKQEFQDAVDAAAIATANEMSLSDVVALRLSAVAETSIKANLLTRKESLLKNVASTLNATTKADEQKNTVLIKASIEPFLFFNALRSIRAPSKLNVAAEARIIGTVRVCMIGLEKSKSKTIYLERDARMTGHGCAVFSNSTDSNGIKSKDSAMVKASLICSAGGSVGGKANFTPDPMTDCPVFEDPLSDRPEPATPDCTYKGVELEEGSHTLEPGTYCGGIKISGSAKVSLRPGEYIIKDGPLQVLDKAAIYGEYVGFFFTGSSANFFFDDNSDIHLTAPKTGSMAGILMFAERSSGKELTYRINSNYARMLLGTIYLPNGHLEIDAEMPIADQSAYTVVIVKTLKLYGGPDLVLNTNYADTDIPVPDGIKGLNGTVTLTR